MKRTGFLDAFKLAFDAGDAFLNEAAVSLELAFTRAAKEAEAAALALQMGPGADQTALLVLQMGQFDLQRAFTRGGAPAKDLEDEAGAIEHLGTPFLLEIALLDGRELGVDDDEFGLRLLHHLGDFGHLAGTEQCGGFGCCDGGDDCGLDLEVDGERQTHGLLQPRFDGAVGGGWRAAVTAVDMEDDGAGCGLAFNLEVDASAAPALLACRQPAACSSSNRLIGPPGMMVEMACL